MKTTQNTPKSAIIDAILDAFYQLRAQKVVKTQKEFASLCDVSQPTMSAALAGNETYLTDNFVSKVRTAVRAYGVEISGTLNAGGDVTIDNSQKILSSPEETDTAKWFALVGEKDKQIDRLLGIIENMQGK